MASKGGGGGSNRGGRSGVSSATTSGDGKVINLLERKEMMENDLFTQALKKGKIEKALNIAIQNSNVAEKEAREARQQLESNRKAIADKVTKILEKNKLL